MMPLMTGLTVLFHGLIIICTKIYNFFTGKNTGLKHRSSPLDKSALSSIFVVATFLVVLFVAGTYVRSALRDNYTTWRLVEDVWQHFNRTPEQAMPHLIPGLMIAESPGPGSSTQIYYIFKI